MAEHQDLVRKVSTYVESYMNNFDGSHDFYHIKRVLGLAHTIYAEVSKSTPNTELNLTIITLAALLHDVGDRKYIKPGEDPNILVQNLLLSFGAPPALAQKVQTICAGVSYFNEIQDPQKVIELILEHPELAIVQDADRLDAIGAVGVGRVFTYGGAKAKRSMDESVQVFDSKLLKLENCMKTKVGKRIARERTEHLRTFMKWWDAEVEVQSTADEVLTEVGAVVAGSEIAKLSHP
ncbi:hypothetical protein B0O99DRAFT_607709 [Bisporella sp. PMI_857]|nr:hypothetical protein B0O99DRAFT_607709 [Bisporella sp. PMI_857]